ncbi:hypothetical protein DFM91_005444 [Clostridium beijerinckii]|nr:hypothetical protein [Clostridium beijerinckii]
MNYKITLFSKDILIFYLWVTSSLIIVLFFLCFYYFYSDNIYKTAKTKSETISASIHKSVSTELIICPQYP